MAYSRISSTDAIRVRNLEARLGSRTLRQILTPEGNRLMRPDRIANLSGGSGRLTEYERERLEIAFRNSNQLVGLKKRGIGKREFKVNRALRNWINYGKAKGDENNDDSQKAIRALRFLGIDPNDGTFYIAQMRG